MGLVSSTLNLGATVHIFNSRPVKNFAKKVIARLSYLCAR